MACLAAKHLNFERALDKCSRAMYKALTEAGNRVSGTKVIDGLTASGILT